MKGQSYLLGFLLFLIACQKKIVNEESWEALEVEVTGDDYHWYFQYPGPDTQLFTEDDIVSSDEFCLPLGSVVTILLKSSDFIYTFSLPDYEAKEMAIPGLTHSIELITNQKGVFTLKGDQMCGFTHESLMGELKILSVNQFQKWLKSKQ